MRSHTRHLLFKTSLFFILFSLFFSFSQAASLKGFFRYETAIQSSHFLLRGSTPSEQFGGILAKGDFNADGIQDFAVSSPTYSSNGKNFRGKVSLFFGKSGFFPSQPSAIFIGTQADDQLGLSLAFGDLDHDRVDDLVMGTARGGRVLVMWGRRNPYLDTMFDFSERQPDLAIQSIYDEEKFGFSLDILDINGDSWNDLAIGAPLSTFEKDQRAGRVYILYGSESFKRDSIRHLYYRPAQVVLGGAHAKDQFGSTLTHGDFNGDGIHDLAVGAYLDGIQGMNQRGTVSIFYGSREKQLPKKPGDILSGQQAYSWFSYSLSSGDINGDSVSDLIASSFPFSRTEIRGRVDVFFGGEKGKLEDRKMTLNHSDLHHVFGSAVAAGDINHDGNDDIFVGAPGIRGETSNYPGRLFVFNDFKRDINQSLNLQEDFRIGGASSYDWFGSTILFDDFNGDGTPDLIVGAPSDLFEGQGRLGGVYIFPGPLLPRGEIFYQIPSEEEIVTRASLVDQVVRSLDLKKKHRTFLNQCEQVIEICLYDFTGKSRFDGMRLQPKLILYPDISVDDPYYESVNIATLLGLTQGYSSEKNSPFHPDEPISRIHALKILLQAADVLQWKERAELRKELGGLLPLRQQKTPFLDIDAKIPHMWWYPRYVNYAHLTKIISDQQFFAPDKPLTQKVLNEWLKNTVSLIGSVAPAAAEPHASLPARSLRSQFFQSSQSFIPSND